MRKLSQRSVLLFGVVLAVCAFAPSMASAGSWSPIATTHQLFSPNLSFTTTSAFFGHTGWLCSSSEFDADVVSANTLELTTARLNGCFGVTSLANCTLTAVATRLPWTATATATDNVQIHGMHFDMRLENTPGNPTPCSFGGLEATWTGTLTGGSWSPTSNEMFLVNAPGTTLHIPALASSSAVVATGTLRDTAGTLRMFM